RGYYPLLPSVNTSPTDSMTTTEYGTMRDLRPCCRSDERVLFLRLEDVRRDDHNGGIAPVFLPKRGVPSRRQQLTGMMITRRASVAVLGQRSLQDIRDPWPVLMGMQTNHAARIEFEYTESKLPSL